MINMRLVLLGANVSILILLGVYLLNLFSIRDAGIESIAMLFLASITALVLVNEFVERYQIKNFLAFLVPGLAAIAVSFLYRGGGAGLIPVAFVLGVMLTVPGIVLLLQSAIGRQKQ